MEHFSFLIAYDDAREAWMALETKFGTITEESRSVKLCKLMGQRKGEESYASYISKKRNMFMELNGSLPKHSDGLAAYLHKELLFVAVILWLSEDSKQTIRSWGQKSITVELIEARIGIPRGSHHNPVEISKVQERSKKKCSYCEKVGHIKETCWKKYPGLRTKRHRKECKCC